MSKLMGQVPGTAAIGAERKDMTLLTEFRSSL